MANFTLNEARGVIPAMLTPFHADETLDIEGAKKLTSYLIAQGIGGLYLTGSTGEGFLMESDERKAFVEAVLEENAGRVPIIVHVGAISTRASEELARHAAKAGADAISSVPPIYWKFSNDEIERYYADLVQAAGIPMVVYNIALAGLVSFDMLVRLGSVEGVQGLKYTSATLYDVFRIKQELGETFMVYSGSDELAISGLAFGADGIIGSTYNVLAGLFVPIWNLMQEGRMDEARAMQKKANRLIFTLLKHNLMPSLKQTLTFAGLPGGVARRPFTHLSANEAEALKNDYAAIKAEEGDLGLDFLKAI